MIQSNRLALELKNIRKLISVSFQKKGMSTWVNIILRVFINKQPFENNWHVSETISKRRLPDNSIVAALNIAERARGGRTTTNAL